MNPVYYVDDAGKAVTDIPQGALVQRLPGLWCYLEKRNHEATPLIYGNSIMDVMGFWVSDGIERTEVYLDPIWAITSWKLGDVFAEKRQEDEQYGA